MDTSSMTCADCPFKRGCPLKTRVKSPCAIGRNPVKFYLSGWMAAIAASLILF
jgi:hypothetical protein